MKTQREVVLKHLQKKSISSMEAFDRYGITRLSAVIYDLRHEGNKIIVENKTVKNRYGRQVTYASYRLVK